MRHLFVVGVFASVIGPCFGLGGTPPLETTSVVRPFAPIGRYAGHWGIDLSLDPGADVRSAGAGVVTFAGPIVGRLSVTVHHGGAVRTSYSYLGSITVHRGDTVFRGDVIGTSNVHDGRDAFHFSLRLGDEYVDPLAALACVAYPGPALFLAPSQATYAVTRVRHSRRNVRPSPRGPPSGCPCCL